MNKRDRRLLRDKQILEGTEPWWYTFGPPLAALAFIITIVGIALYV